MTGKDRCKQLKRYRNKLAQVNNIDFVSKECNFEGECPGFCPACDEEILFLEEELKKKERRGERINFKGLIKLSFKNGDKTYAYTSPNNNIMMGKFVDRNPGDSKSHDTTSINLKLEKLIAHSSDNTNKNEKTSKDNDITTASKTDNILMGDIIPDDYIFDGFFDNDNENGETSTDNDTPNTNENIDISSIHVLSEENLLNFLDSIKDVFDDNENIDDDNENFDDDDENFDDEEDDGDDTTFLGWIEDPKGDW